MSDQFNNTTQFKAPEISNPADKWGKLVEALVEMTQVMRAQVLVIQQLAESNLQILDAMLGDEPEQPDETEQPGVDMSGKRITLS